jgi:hypothetical protein
MRKLFLEVITVL